MSRSSHPLHNPSRIFSCGEAFYTPVSWKEVNRLKPYFPWSSRLSRDEPPLQEHFYEGKSVSVINPSAYAGAPDSGVFTLEVSVPRYSESGTWFLDTLSVRDYLGQDLELRADDGTLAAAGYDFTIENTGS